MAPAKLFVGAVAKRLDFVVVQDEVAVGSKQVVGHQAGVVRTKKHLGVELK